MKNDEYLAFVDEIGRGIDGGYVYRLDFTYDPDSVWGDFFNSIPAVIVPDLQPDKNALSSTATIKTDRQLSLAKKNGCFSMQDCIDGIISLCFFEYEDETTDEESVFKLDFGDTLEDVIDKLDKIGVSLDNKKDIDGDDSEIDTLITNMKSGLKSDFAVMEFVVGENYKREDIKRMLFDNEYRFVDLVENEGEFAIRGFMIDIYSYGAEYPFRVSFFGDEVEDIFSFNIEEGVEVNHYDRISVYMKMEDE